MGAVSYYSGMSPRLAESFIKAVESGIESILRFSEAWQIVEEDVRRHLINRFSQTIRYFFFTSSSASSSATVPSKRMCPLSIT